MSDGARVKEHMLNLLNALANLSPSRSMISQLVLLLPEESVLVERSYPELASPEAKGVLESLGVKFGYKVERAQNSFAEALYKHIHNIFDWLDDELLFTGQWTIDQMNEVRSSLAKLTGVHIDSIPNPYKEWARLVLRKLSTLYGKEKVLKFLKTLLDRSSFEKARDYKDRALQEFSNKLKAEIAISPPELKELQRFMLFAEGESEHIYHKGSSRHPEGDLWIEHSKYHLDPLICESYRYTTYTGWGIDYEYRVRHKKSLSEALMEACA